MSESNIHYEGTVGGGGTLASPPAPHTDILSLEFFRHRSCLPLYLSNLSSAYGRMFVASYFFSDLLRPGIRSNALSIVSIIQARIIRFCELFVQDHKLLMTKDRCGKYSDLAPSAVTKSSVLTKIAHCSRQQQACCVYNRWK